MPLSPGQKIGPYEVLSSLGAGGMGEVYRARDTKLNREVALKLLPEVFASDTDRLSRFTREAQTLASLNHPHIAQIYGLEESHGVRALVMELIEGDDLSNRIARGPIPIDESLPIATQIAEALESAHEKGIVHRDLKPSNIKLTANGTVKLLDFGLAKAMGGDISSNFAVSQGQFSPDGRWVAYASNESGKWEVYVTPLLESGTNWRISSDGGTEPKWRRDGKELFYIAPNGWLMAVRVKEGSAFEADVATPLFLTRLRQHISNTDLFSYDVSPDGQRFLMNTDIGETTAQPLTIVLNWPAQFKK